MSKDNDIARNRISMRVGRTPLLRSKGLGKALGIEDLHLKLEGTNPSGHKCDRRSMFIIRKAMNSGARSITVATIGYMARSMSVLCDIHGLDFHPFVPKANPGPDPPMGAIRTDGTLEDAIEASREAARSNGWYDANPRVPESLDSLAYSSISREIAGSLHKAPGSVSLPVSTGSMAFGVHAGFLEMNVSEEGERIPVMVGGTVRDGNALLRSFADGGTDVEYIEVPNRIRTGPLGPLVYSGGPGGSEVLDSFRSSGGALYGFDRQELLGMRSLLRSKEGIVADIYSVAGLSALVSAMEEGIVDDGPHVVILSTGKPDVMIREISIKDEDPQELVKTLDRWLGRYTDPGTEITDALQNAFSEGYVLGAYMGRDLVGLAVLSRMHFKEFFPSYHLSYIASDPTITGRGVGTGLMDAAIDLTGGDFSLHVEPDNRKAINVYRKMGMEVKYLRMHFMKGSGR